MIKSRDRKNSRTEETTTNQPQISKQKHNCLLFCCRRRCIVVIVDLVSFDGRDGSSDEGGVDWPKAVRLFCHAAAAAAMANNVDTHRKMCKQKSFVVLQFSAQTMRLYNPSEAGSQLSLRERQNNAKMKLAQKFFDSQTQHLCERQR